MGSQFNIRDMPERSIQQLNDLQGWGGYTKTQLVLIAIDRLWQDTKRDRNKRLSQGYIEIRLTPEQLDLQDEINEKCKGVWYPTPGNPHDTACIIGVAAETNTVFLDNLGVEYRLVER